MGNSKQAPIDPAFGRRIAQIRTSRGMKQTELAGRLNVHKVTLHGWETGRRRVDPVSIKRIADILGVTVDELFVESDSDPVAKAG